MNATNDLAREISSMTAVPIALILQLLELLIPYIIDCMDPNPAQRVKWLFENHPEMARRRTLRHAQQIGIDQASQEPVADATSYTVRSWSEDQLNQVFAEHEV